MGSLLGGVCCPGVAGEESRRDGMNAERISDPRFFETENSRSKKLKMCSIAADPRDECTLFNILEAKCAHHEQCTAKPGRASCSAS
jgi:hypothetical protein